MTTTNFSNALRVGDTLTVADDVTVGDIVFVERLRPTLVVARVMTEDRLPGFTGKLFFLSGISSTGSAQFQEISRDDLDLA